MTRTLITLRAFALTILYLTALAGATVLVEPLPNFLIVFVLVSAAYFFVGAGLTAHHGDEL
uniref:Uncharacterized protein n=1 Tax=viral metagenome TaxID=1070528 RepID=A0A6M3K925_9ZZZZ